MGLQEQLSPCHEEFSWWMEMEVGAVEGAESLRLSRKQPTVQLKTQCLDIHVSYDIMEC